MGVFHVPIDYSKLQEVIRSDDEILYSTLCVVQVYKIDLKSKTRVDKYLTHVFLTKLGFAMTSSLAKEEYTLTFLPWIDQAIWKDVGYDNNQLIFTKDDFNFIYEPVPDERFEEPDLFEQRSKSFVNQIQDLKALISSDNEKYILRPPLSVQQLKTTEKSNNITKEFINEILQISPDFYVPVDYSRLFFA